jgi:hypothetical protein
VAAALITVADVQNFMGASSGDLSNDALVQTYIDAVTEVIESYTQPIVDGPRTVTFSGGTSSLVLPFPFSSVTSITESGVTLTGTDYYADGVAGIISRGTTTAALGWAYGSRNIVVVVQTGSTPTATQTTAALELFKHMWSRRNAPRPALGNVAPDGYAMSPAGYLVPNFVEALLCVTPSFPGFA